jgi:hypothetical protein
MARVLGEARIETGPGKHRELRGDGQRVADDDIYHGLDE